jgi:hypothetical protein
MRSLLPSSVLLLFVFLSSCGIYSFTGASVSPETKSVEIGYFENRASLIQPSLSSTFTEKMKDKFVSQTNLSLVQRDGDLVFSGYISDYQSTPVAIQGNEQAALNRLSVSVSVKFTNKNDTKQDFETTFTRYSDFDSRKNLSTVESELLNEICNQLTDDIFNKAVINW